MRFRIVKELLLGWTITVTVILSTEWFEFGTSKWRYFGLFGYLFIGMMSGYISHSILNYYSQMSAKEKVNK